MVMSGGERIAMGRTSVNGSPAFRFLVSEVAAMERALDDAAGATPARSVVEGLAEQFTNSPARADLRPVAWKQVWNWFQNRRHAQKAKIERSRAVASSVEPSPPSRVVAVAGTSAPKKVDVPMDFEARSARDGAWYDVSAFIEKRTLNTDLPQVKVRFAGFGAEEDEWVSITNAVRQRSLPCETTECVAVLPGDLILCFQEGSEQALYYDADILDVQRRRHDVRGCRCRFWVRYRHDQTEEVVPLRKVCRRPETEQRLQLAREGSSGSKVGPLSVTPGVRPVAYLPSDPPYSPAQPSSAVNPHAGTTSTPYTPLQQAPSTSVQPIPMQSMSTPDSRPSIHQQTVPSFSASTSVLPGAAVSSVQDPAPRTPLITQSTTAATLASAQQSAPSIESSITRQLNIAAPVQQDAQVEPHMSGTSTPVANPAVSGAPEQPAFPTPGEAIPSNLAQLSLDQVSSTPAVGSNAAAGTSTEAAHPSAPTTEVKPSVTIDLSSTPGDEATGF